jgi:hypothetical protein
MSGTLSITCIWLSLGLNTHLECFHHCPSVVSVDPMPLNGSKPFARLRPVSKSANWVLKTALKFSGSAVWIYVRRSSLHIYVVPYLPKTFLLKDRYLITWDTFFSCRMRSIPRNGSRQPHVIASQWFLRRNRRGLKYAITHSHEMKIIMGTGCTVERVEKFIFVKYTT